MPLIPQEIVLTFGLEKKKKTYVSFNGPCCCDQPMTRTAGKHYRESASGSMNKSRQCAAGGGEGGEGRSEAGLGLREERGGGGA